MPNRALMIGTTEVSVTNAALPLFRTLDRKRNLTENRMLRQDAHSMIKRRASSPMLLRLEKVRSTAGWSDSRRGFGRLYASLSPPPFSVAMDFLRQIGPGNDLDPENRP
jgi:hypothetical protein